MGGVWYNIKKAWWSIFLGVEIDLSIRFPEFPLGLKVNMFHVLTALLFLADVGDQVLGPIQKRLAGNLSDDNSSEEETDEPNAGDRKGTKLLATKDADAHSGD